MPSTTVVIYYYSHADPFIGQVSRSRSSKARRPGSLGLRGAESCGRGLATPFRTSGFQSNIGLRVELAGLVVFNVTPQACEERLKLESDGKGQHKRKHGNRLAWLVRVMFRDLTKQVEVNAFHCSAALGGLPCKECLRP